MYNCSKVCARLNTVKSKYFTVDVELCHWCVLSLLLFIVYMYLMDRHGLAEECVTIESNRIGHLLFADDLVLLASSEPDLQHALYRFATICKE